MTERTSNQWLDSRGWRERWEAGGYIPADTQILLTEIERLRAALADTLSEVVEVRKNIIEASALDPNRGDKKYDEAYQKETARLDAMIYRARAALEQEAPK